MEYLDGLNLDEIVREEGYLDLDRFFNVFQQVCDALITAHDKRVIHRDIKPSNIMVCATDTGFKLVKVLDFGVARVFQQASRDGVRLTQLGEILGSPAYMAPVDQGEMARAMFALSDVLKNQHKIQAADQMAQEAQAVMKTPPK